MYLCSSFFFREIEDTKRFSVNSFMLTADDRLTCCDTYTIYTLWKPFLYIIYSLDVVFLPHIHWKLFERWVQTIYTNTNEIVELCVSILWRSHHSSKVYLYCVEETTYVERILIFTVVEYVPKYGFPRLLFSLRCDRLPLPFKSVSG